MEELQQVITQSRTYGEVLKYFHLDNRGGNSKTLKRRIQRDNLDASNILKLKGNGGWNRGMKGFQMRRMSKEDALRTIFIKNYQGGSKPRQYIRFYNLLDERCQCGQGTLWNGKPLVLELDHIDGNSHNNEISNLRWICGHCHSQTPTFRGRKNRKHHFCLCGKEIWKGSQKCQSCSTKSLERDEKGRIKMVQPEVVETSPYRIKGPVPVLCGIGCKKLEHHVGNAPT